MPGKVLFDFCAAVTTLDFSATNFDFVFDTTALSVEVFLAVVALVLSIIVGFAVGVDFRGRERRVGRETRFEEVETIFVDGVLLDSAFAGSRGFANGLANGLADCLAKGLANGLAEGLDDCSESRAADSDFSISLFKKFV